MCIKDFSHPNVGILIEQINRTLSIKGFYKYEHKLFLPKGKKFSREEISANLPRIRENKFREIHQNSSIRKNFFHEINQNSSFAKVIPVKF